MVSGGTSRVWWRAAVALAAFAVVATGLGAGPRSGDASAYKAPESAVVPQADKAPESAVVPEADEASDSDEAPEADDASCDETFTYWDGDAERTVSLCDEIPDDSGGGDRDDFRGGRADPVGAGCASGASDGDGLLFRSEQGVEMTLTHSVVLVLDPGWGDTQVRRFLARNRIPPSCASPLGWLPNGFAIATGPGIAALELANQLAPQHGVVLSSPNWASEVEVKTESDSSTPVSAPTITALHPSDRSITVVWEPPSDLPDGVDVTYEIAWIASNKAGRADARWWTTRGIGGSSRHYLLQPFREGSGEEPTNGVRYSVKVRAVTDKPGRWSRVVAATPFERSGLSIGGSWPSTPFDVPIGGFQDAKPDLDVFKIEIAARTGVLVRTGGSVENTSCSIYNAERDQVEGTRTHRSGGYPGIQGQCMVYAILDPGDWYLTVNGFGWQSSPLHHGSYTVQIESVAPTGQSLESALAAVQGERRYGFIGRDPGEADVWRLDVAGREFIDVHIENLYNGIKASLHDSTGEPVEVIVTPLYTLCSVRGCTGFNTRVRAELAAGTYYLKIRSEDEWSASYTLMRHIDHHYRNLVTLCEGLERAEGVDDLLGGCQWHLDSRGQRGASVGEDANVAAAHRAGYLGEGVHVAVVDTGIDLGHDDLSANTDPTRSRAYCGSDTAPHSSGFNHGTAVAGVVAARDNQIGMRGVAPRATLHNRRLLGDGCEVTAENVADAMTASMADICVNTNSWGWYDGVSASPSALLFDLAIDRGVTAGCGGKGISYVWSAGNGHRFGDDSNLSEYTNHYGVMSVCAVNAHGLRSVYSEHGANLWVCGPSNDRGDGIPGVATTTNHDRYRTDFGGTSAAAPIVAGVAALVRGANSELTWRDVKLILAGSARQ
ncbi:MAG: S8 family serine peptidase, partial [bacterium]|nr:S8 family serine peptidase [bacterium]